MIVVSPVQCFLDHFVSISCSRCLIDKIFLKGFTVSKLATYLVIVPLLLTKPLRALMGIEGDILVVFGTWSRTVKASLEPQ